MSIMFRRNFAVVCLCVCVRKCRKCQLCHFLKDGKSFVVTYTLFGPFERNPGVFVVTDQIANEPK